LRNDCWPFIRLVSQGAAANLQGGLDGLVEHANGSSVQAACQCQGQLQKGAALLAGAIATLGESVCCWHVRHCIPCHLHHQNSSVRPAMLAEVREEPSDSPAKKPPYPDSFLRTVQYLKQKRCGRKRDLSWT